MGAYLRVQQRVGCGGWPEGEAVAGWVETGVEGPRVGVALSLLRRPSTATVLRCKGSR
jgi:hypothetical protein